MLSLLAVTLLVALYRLCVEAGISSRRPVRIPVTSVAEGGAPVPDSFFGLVPERRPTAFDELDGAGSWSRGNLCAVFVVVAMSVEAPLVAAFAPEDEALGILNISMMVVLPMMGIALCSGF